MNSISIHTCQQKNGFNSIYIMILEAAVHQVYIENIKQ